MFSKDRQTFTKWNYILADLSFANKCLKPISHVPVWSGEPLLCYRVNRMRKVRCSLCDVLLLGVSLKGAVLNLKQILTRYRK